VLREWKTQRRHLDDVEAVVAILLQDHKVAAATHNIMAYRIAQPNGVWAQDHDDDGETAAGKNLLHLMQLVDVVDVVVVRPPRMREPASTTYVMIRSWQCRQPPSLCRIPCRTLNCLLGWAPLGGDAMVRRNPLGAGSLQDHQQRGTLPAGRRGVHQAEEGEQKQEQQSTVTSSIEVRKKCVPQGGCPAAVNRNHNGYSIIH